MTDTVYDLLVIGGGINGAGIAADASGRGLRVLLAEQNDLASGTSSASSKLIHGGLRYLEHREFRLVREALGEREILLRKAPHLIWPLRFILPDTAATRSPLLIRAGLMIYDTLARRDRLERSRRIDLTVDPAGRPLASEMRRGFCYADCWADDARLVIVNAIAARELGATVWTRARVQRFRRDGLFWRATIEHDGLTADVAARAIVNAGGPWAAGVARSGGADSQAASPAVKLVKGSHIVVRRIAGASDAYLLQNDDGRIVFALPFEQHFTLIGTTDVAFTGNPSDAVISPEEETYLLAAANRFLRTRIAAEEIVHRFAGVRPLFDDGQDNPSAVSRDYVLQLDQTAGAPLLNVIGGKLTTYRRLAEAALDKLAPHFAGLGPAWTASYPLPGGDIPDGDFERWFGDAVRLRPRFDDHYLRRLARRYGTRMDRVIGDAHSERDLGLQVAGLSEREIDYLRREEWAVSADDVLWRRTKTALGLDGPDLAAVTASIERALQS